jgi:hypothetical protein
MEDIENREYKLSEAKHAKRPTRQRFVPNDIPEEKNPEGTMDDSQMTGSTGDIPKESQIGQQEYQSVDQEDVITPKFETKEKLQKPKINPKGLDSKEASSKYLNTSDMIIIAKLKRRGI